MEYEPGEYTKLAIRQYPPRSLRETAEGKYWRRFRAPVVAKQFGAVSHIDFCQQHPYNLAITASTRVIVYNGHSRQVGRTFSRFKDVAFSGCFRSDGKLLAAGSADGVVQVFDANSRSVLRQFKGHQRPTHVTRFSPDKLHVLSGSDDVTIRWWDVSTGEQVARLDGHTDYVRAACVSPVAQETWISGGYDHAVKLWDVRDRSASLSFDHGAPVEDVAFFPSGSLAVSAGGNYLCVWDMVAGRLLRKLPNFQKTVTCVRLSPLAGPDSAAAPRMVAGSLDAHVKIFELDTFKVTHSSRYPAPVLSLGVSPDAGLLAVGMADGMLSIRKHVRPKVASGTAAAAGRQEDGRVYRRPAYVPRLTAANFRYFIRGQNARAAADDYRIKAQQKARLAPYDKLLRQFRYREALDAALSTTQPELVVSVIEELAARGGLAGALGGRNAEGVLALSKFVGRYIGEPRYTRLLCGIAHRLLDQYAEVVGVSPKLDAAFARIRMRLFEELGVQGELMKLAGLLEPVLAASTAGMSLT